MKKIIIFLPGNKIILFITITIVWKSLNEFSSTLLLLKRKRLQVNYPVSYTHLDVYKRQDHESDVDDIDDGDSDTL